LAGSVYSSDAEVDARLHLLREALRVGFAVALVNTPAMLGKHERWDRLSEQFETYSTPI
jgi:hypothetical protein